MSISVFKMTYLVIKVFLFLGLYLNFVFGLMDTCSGTKCKCSSNAGVHSMDCTAKNIDIVDACKQVAKYEIVVLKAGENNFGRLISGSLNGCENLMVLDLHYNQIVKIDEHTFSNFSNLKYLDLRANNLNIYDGNGSLNFLPRTVEVLKIGGNFQKNTFPNDFYYPDVPSLLLLKYIYLDGADSEFGIEYKNITGLSLSAKTRFTYCYIPTITNTTFSNLVNVESLNLSFCNISYISAGAFENLRRLNSLDLSLNIRLGFSALGVFSYGLQFTNIQFLDYTRVYPTFGRGTELKKEHVCYLRNTSLKALLLDNNNINSIETNAIILLPEALEKVYFNENRPMFGPYISQIGCLENINLFRGSYQYKYHNPFNYVIELQFNDFIDKDTSIVSNCNFMNDENLRKIAKTRTNCPYLENTDVKQIFEPTIPVNLKHLEFSNINMHFEVDVLISVNPSNNSLKYADFSGNGLFSLKGPVGPFLKVQTLLLSNNFCENIGPNFFDNMTDIEYLDLSDNNLGPFFISEGSKVVFKRLRHMQKLNLARNKITTLYSETFSPLNMLTSLNLNQNKIKTFNINPDNLNSLLILKLAYNSLSTLPAAVRFQLIKNSDRLGHNFTLNLIGNDLQFDCNNTDFLRWIYKYRFSMQHFKNYTYTGKFFVQVLNITEIDKLERSCSSYVVLIILCSIVLAVFFSIVIVGVVYRNRWKIRYFLYMSKAGFFGFKRFKEAPDVDNYRFDAFISYAEENLRFIVNELIHRLEGQGEDFALCIHQRDFVAGNAVSDNITDAITKSRKTVVILSKMFIKKRWCMYEFNMARMESIYSRDCSYLVVVMLEDVPVKDMPLEMVEWIKNNSYIEYTTDEQGEALFWDKLKQAIVN